LMSRAAATLALASALSTTTDRARSG